MTIIPFDKDQSLSDDPAFCEYCHKPLEIWHRRYEENVMLNMEKKTIEIVLMCLPCTIELHNRGDLTKVDNPYYVSGNGELPFRYEFTRHRIPGWHGKGDIYTKKDIPSAGNTTNNK